MMKFREDRFTTQKGDFTIEYPPKTEDSPTSEPIEDKGLSKGGESTKKGGITDGKGRLFCVGL